MHAVATIDGIRWGWGSIDDKAEMTSVMSSPQWLS